MNKIQKLEKRYHDLVKEATKILAEAKKAVEKRERAFCRFSGAIRGLLKSKLRKNDVLFLRGRSKLIVLEASRDSVASLYPNRSWGVYRYVHYNEISSVQRKGRIIYKNGELTGRGK